MNIELMLHPKSFTRKEDTVLYGGYNISLELLDHPTEISIEEFADLVGTKGHTFCSAICKNQSRTKANFKHSQMIIIDVDNKKDDNILFPEKALEILKENELEPTLMYKTLSHKEEKPKFRIIWIRQG